MGLANYFVLPDSAPWVSEEKMAVGEAFADLFRVYFVTGQVTPMKAEWFHSLPRL